MNDSNKKIFSEHAKEQMPFEACALLIIEKGIEKIILCKNIADNKKNQFIICPDDYVLAESRGQVISVVHSHPFSSPLPSDGDKVSCEKTKLIWHIYGVSCDDWYELRPNNFKIPFVGRQFMHGVLDCYSIIKDYFEFELSILIPDFDRKFEWWNAGQNLYLDNFSKAGFVEVKNQTLKKNDVILMQINSPVPNHGAIYLGEEKILHQLSGRLSSIDVYGGYWQKHTVKILRHEELL